LEASGYFVRHLLRELKPPESLNYLSVCFLLCPFGATTLNPWQKTNSMGMRLAENIQMKGQKEHKKMKTRFTVRDAKLVQNRPYCTRDGKGVMMADKGDFYVCGKCGLRVNKKLFDK
jgi:ribosomal protein S27AE